MGIPRVRTSVVCLHQDKLLAFRAIDPHSQKEFIFLPGGKIESDETAPEAGERETMEETGYAVRVDAQLSTDREYPFHWNDQDFDCLTLFYVGLLASPMAKPVNDAPYNQGVVWVPFDQIKKTFSYSEEILDAILELIEMKRKMS